MLAKYSLRDSRKTEASSSSVSSGRRGDLWVAGNEVVGDKCVGVACQLPSFAVAIATIVE
jgi:hypothetical protein